MTVRGDELGLTPKSETVKSEVEAWIAVLLAGDRAPTDVAAALIAEGIGLLNATAGPSITARVLRESITRLPQEH